MVLGRIASHPARINGQPTVRGTRLRVRRVVELVALDSDRAALQQEFPELDAEDERQALLYAASYLDDRVINYPVPYDPAA
jgi:uncharacterized protein (DUF433 family)